METIYDQLRKEQKINEVFRFLGQQQEKLQKVADSLKEEVCEDCGEVSDRCECDNEFNKL